MSNASASPAIAVIAEEEVLVRLVTADMLEEAGFRVIEASDVATALDHLTRHPQVTLLFTDIEMPGPMNAIKLAQEALRRWPHISVVGCSGRVCSPEGALLERVVSGCCAAPYCGLCECKNCYLMSQFPTKDSTPE